MTIIETIRELLPSADDIRKCRGQETVAEVVWNTPPDDGYQINDVWEAEGEVWRALGDRCRIVGTGFNQEKITVEVALA